MIVHVASKESRSCEVDIIALDYGGSSSSYALQLCESFGLLNVDLPFGAILDLFSPLNNFHPSHVIPDVIFPSGLGSSCWSSCERFLFIYFLYNTLFPAFYLCVQTNLVSGI
jgi:hypothetical protein